MPQHKFLSTPGSEQKKQQTKCLRQKRFSDLLKGGMMTAKVAQGYNYSDFGIHFIKVWERKIQQAVITSTPTTKVTQPR